MKITPIIWISFLLAGLGCIAGGLYLCYLGKDGWGWFLVVAVLILGGITIGGDKKYTESQLRSAYDHGKDNTMPYKDFLESLNEKDEDED